MTSFLAELQATSHLSDANAAFIETLYENYLTDPASVAASWRAYFDALQVPGTADIRHGPILARFRQLAHSRQAPAAAASPEQPANQNSQVSRLINAYRTRGHQRAHLDPLGLSGRPAVPDLELSAHGLSTEDFDTLVETHNLASGQAMKLGDLLRLLERVYCRSIGAEYMHITATEERRWLQQRLEGEGGHFRFDRDRKRHILERLSAAEGLEKYLHTKYVGQKRFSLEGGDVLIPVLHDLIQRVGTQGVAEVVLGMAHRGRLNVLVNLLGKSPKLLFEEFEGKHVNDDPFYSGDVKYHQGFSCEMQTPGGKVHIALGFNPSHLEIIDPVVVGSARARQTRRGDSEHREVMPVLIHGDAAFAGQGVIMELFNMSQARGFRVGGTLHIIVNNQIGFTTSHALDARSTLYCTEVAKMVQAPILHVNADDPEAAMFAMELASDFRAAFRKDVVIDLVCYRRHGHNEADEPAVTQPLMYRTIRALQTTREIYAEKLIAEGVLSAVETSAMLDTYRQALDEGRPVAEISQGPFTNPYTIDWAPHIGARLDEKANTEYPLEAAQTLAQGLLTLPPGFELHPRVQRIMADRQRMASGEIPMDWGFAETLAYATLLNEGYSLRLVGQDSGRGTFFHRHAVLHNQKDAAVLTPLARLVKTDLAKEHPQQSCLVIDSLLSEEAVLGFEYGYSSSDPRTLVVWEAQFGDFVNGAQVVIDQFIASGEAKWGRLCSLVMFLPHGYEGQGPEHSSARPERFMQLCAQFNMQVCMPTTPAQMFHLLRRQMLRKARKPLIVLTPKSLLRNKSSTSRLELVAKGHFQEVIPDRVIKDTDAVQRVVLCSGKVYYDLTAERKKRKAATSPIVRVEQLYPFPREELSAQLARYPAANEIVWCQEEPMNQGAWYQIRHHLQAGLAPTQRLLYAGRNGSPSPAVGLYQKHMEQQQTLVDNALTAGQGIEYHVE